MEDDSTRDLIVRGMAAASAREFKEARYYFEWALRREPPLQQRAEILLRIAEVSEDPAEQRRLVEEALVCDPSDGRARRKLAILKGELDPNQIVDPDHLAAPAPGSPQAADARRFTCPNCGGKMVYSPDGRSLVCEYCASRPKKGAPGTPGGPGGGALREQDFIIAMATARGHGTPLAQKTFSCQGCSSVFLLPPQQITLTCPFCASAYVVANPELRQLVRPEGVLPFIVNEESARLGLRAWLAEHCPGAAQTIRLEGTQGIYLPVWTFDIGGMVTWRYEEKVTESTFGMNRRAVWLLQTGEQIVYYNDLPQAASNHLPEACRPELDNYDLTATQPYADSYLADWPAETYQVTVGDAAVHARAEAFAREQERGRQKISGEIRNLVFSSSGMIIESFKLVLLPAWLAHYTVEGRRYDLIVNGQNGHVQGSHPPSGVGGFFARLIGN